jgi:hypothetical protein
MISREQCIWARERNKGTWMKTMKSLGYPLSYIRQVVDNRFVNTEMITYRGRRLAVSQQDLHQIYCNLARSFGIEYTDI